jgi:hypothetical protein
MVNNPHLVSYVRFITTVLTSCKKNKTSQPQVRVNTEGCKIIDKMRPIYGDCHPGMSLLNAEQGDFGYGWSAKNASYEPPNGLGPLYRAFQYRSAHELKGSAYQVYCRKYIC